MTGLVVRIVICWVITTGMALGIQAATGWPSGALPSLLWGMVAGCGGVYAGIAWEARREQL